MKLNHLTRPSLVFLVLAVFSQAEPIAIVNPSGEINNGLDRALISDPSVLGWSSNGGQVIKDRTDYGNGGWRMSIEDSQSLWQLTAHAVQAGAAYSLRFDAAIFAGSPGGGNFSPDLTLVGPEVRNGDFNNDVTTPDSRTFGETPDWVNLGSAGQTSQATRVTTAALSLDGTRNAVLAQNGSRVFAVDTGHTLTAGEVFQATYQWVDGSNWNDAADRVGVTLFTTGDDTVSGPRTDLETLLSATSAANASYQSETSLFAPIAGAADGKRLFALFEGVDGNNNEAGFARLENFTLQRGTPGVTPPPRVLAAELYIDNGGAREIVATRTWEFKTPTVGSWNHYHLAVPAGSLDAHAGKTLGVQFRSNDGGVANFQSVDNVRLASWPAGAPDGSFHDDWNSTPNQVWTGPGYWANRLQDWQVRNGRVNCILGSRDRRTLHRVGTTIRGNGGNFALSVRTGLHAGTASANSRSGFLLGAGPNLDWRGALLVHDGLGRDFGLFLGARNDGTAVIEDYSTGAVTEVASGATPALGQPAEMRLDLDAVYSGVTGDYTLTIRLFDATNSLLSTASLALPSDRVLGSFGLLSHKGAGDVRYWFDEFAGSGAALNFEPDRHLAILGAQHTLSRGTLKLTAQLPPLSLSANPTVALETWNGADWDQIATAPVDPSDRLSAYTATFTIPGWDDTLDTAYRLRVEIDGTPYDWSGTVRRDPVGKNEIVVAVTNCQRTNDASLQSNGVDWSPIDIWQPHTLAYTHIGKQQPDLLLALGDQIYEGRPTPPDNSNDFNRHHDYLYKWYLWVLQVRDLTRDIPTVAIPDDHDVYQGNLWGEGGIATASQNTGGYVRPASWVRMVERTHTSNLPDPDPYNPIQPPPTIAQGIGVYFTGLVYGRVGFAILEDRKFKTGMTNPPTDPNQQFLLGVRQKSFLRAWATDWAGQDLKLATSQSPLGMIHTHANAGYGFGLNDRDTHGWPPHRRVEAWELLRLSRMCQVAGDQHLSTVVHHGIAGPADAGYSFTAPAIANFFPRCWDPVHNSGGTTPAVSPYKGDFLLNGVGTLPSGDPNLSSAFPHPLRVVAAANPLEYYRQTTGISPAKLHDRGAGYGIVRINKRTRRLTFEAWPLHADPVFPQTGLQFSDWPVTIAQTDNDGRVPAGYLPVIDTHWRKEPVIAVYDEGSNELVYAIRIRGNLFRPPVYDNGTTYRVEVAYGDQTVSEIHSGLVPMAAGALAIRSFTALQPSIVAGQAATLQWDVEAAATLAIDQGYGDVLVFTVDGIGLLEVTPATDTTYTLTVNGTLTAQSTVRVFPRKEEWLATHFTAGERLDPLVSGDGADPDGDGLTNGEEFQFQTDPRDRASALHPQLGFADEAGNLHVEFNSPFPLDAVNCTLVVESSPDLLAWTRLPSNSFRETGRDNNPAEGTSRVTIRLNDPIPGNEAREFYRAYWELHE